MTRAQPAIEVADIVREVDVLRLQAAGINTNKRQRRVLRNIVQCRTAALGGHLERCDGCEHEVPSYNSCRDRHCPKCGGTKRAKWTESRCDELLPVPYFHLVFTLPSEIARLARANPRAIYALLFDCAADTLKQIARDKRYLGADVGFLSVLHTWGQNLEHHPHVHMIVPGGGLDPQTRAWVPSRQGYFLPVRVLRDLFRGKFLCRLKDAYDKGQLNLVGAVSELSDASKFKRYLRPLWKKKWVVYAKAPFGGPEQVLKYLARYTHRVAISNHRLLKFENGEVSFRWKDYRDGNHKVMTLRAEEFVRRFLLHVAPKGLKRIRHHGIFAGSQRKDNLEHCRRLLSVAAEATESSPVPEAVEPPTQVGSQERTCPLCKSGNMTRVAVLLGPTRPPRDTVSLARRDSS